MGELIGRRSCRLATIVAGVCLSSWIPLRAVDETHGTPETGVRGVVETVGRIMARQTEADRTRPPRLLMRPDEESEEERGRSRLRPVKPAPNPLSRPLPRWPYSEGTEAIAELLAPQTLGTSFTAVQTVTGESLRIPPDSMGDVGPDQVLVNVNGRIKVFDRAGNLGALNADPEVFWNPVRNGFRPTDPQVRYDRLSARWIVMAINVADPLNRVMLAVSSGPHITSASSFTFYYFSIDQGGGGSSDNTSFCDYPSLGVDASAIYVGCIMYGPSSFRWTTGFVVRKSSVIPTPGAIVVTAFRNLTGNCGGSSSCGSGSCSTNAGPFAARGVDNDDPEATDGYFIGVDVCAAGRLGVRRVGTPGTTPTISGNLAINTPLTTSEPIPQPASGSTTSLDTADDRLFQAAIHVNKITGTRSLFTAHHIQVNASCTASGSGGRNGARWYEITSLGSNPPAVAQSGTLCDPAGSSPRGYIYPAVAGTGQGHVLLGATVAAQNLFAGVAVAGRLRTDAPGTMQAPTLAHAGLGAYNLNDSSDRNRWGDFSFTDVDPNDDQTVWTFQEYADAPSDEWAIRVVELRAPPPATPSSAQPGSVCAGVAATPVAITGVSSAGSEFFDPGPDTGGPGFASHIGATLTGGALATSTTFTDPTHVSVVLDTTGAVPGPQDLTIVNPDGQTATGASLITILASPSPPAASNNGPICAGSTLVLAASTVPGATYAWSGPNGFVSSEQSPSIPDATEAATGLYSVGVTVGGCTSSAASTSVAVAGTGAACTDPDPCTTADVCQEGGACAGVPVTCTALDACHVAGTCDPGTGTCSNPAVADDTPCDDGNLCTGTDTCLAGACTGASPVTCTASDACHVAGTCNPASGVCSNPPAPNGTACDDADPCTVDACSNGSCVPIGPRLPGEASAVRVERVGGEVVISWTPALDATASDVLRGLLSELPVGPGGAEEVCLADGMADSATTDADDPPQSDAFWYLVRGESACGKGTYGFELRFGEPWAQRMTTTCP